MRRNTLVPWIASLLLLAMAAPPAGAGGKSRKITTGIDPAVSPDGTLLAFVRVTEGNADLYVCRLDGSEARRLTDHAARDASPAWSPDGTRLVFASTRSGRSDLYVVPVDGSTPPRRLTELPGREDDPAWSPDGRRIAFTATRSTGAAIGIVPAGGGEPVFHVGRLRAELSDPSWSPGGRRLVAVSDEKENYDLVVLHLEEEGEGLGPLFIPVGHTHELEPVWHPTRELVLFTSDREFEQEDIFARDARPRTRTVEPGGSKPSLRFVFLAAPASRPRLRQVTQPPYDASHPDWTPDGGSLVYVRGQGLGGPRWKQREPEIWILEGVLKEDKKKKGK